MFCGKLLVRYISRHRCRYVSTNIAIHNLNQENDPVYQLNKHLNISMTKAEFLCLKHPGIRKLHEQHLLHMIEALNDVGYTKHDLSEEPEILYMLPNTVKFRFKVLQECGFNDIDLKHLLSYLQLIKKVTIKELKKKKYLPKLINVENRLASYMTEWPTSLTTLIYGNAEEKTAYELRMKILQRYLELVLELSENEFNRGIITYPNLKHRPLSIINECLTLLQGTIMMPVSKIKNNLYLLHADPENINKIIYSFKTIAGVDIKEIARAYPKILLKSYSSLVDTQKILESYGFTSEAQRKCFEIYTLGPETVRERFKKLSDIPEISVLTNHPRFLKMIYHNNIAMKRLTSLYQQNKKCLSMNILFGPSKNYKLFEKAPGDRSGKGKDLIFCLSEVFQKKYTNSELRKFTQRHPFWINVPIVQVKFVYDKLMRKKFSPKDIYDNCPILLYPWSKVGQLLEKLSKVDNNVFSHPSLEHINVKLLSKCQILSLVLYLLEKNHYFTGNGVWTEDKNYEIEKIKY